MKHTNIYGDSKGKNDRLSKKSNPQGIFAKRAASKGKALAEKIEKSVTKETKGVNGCKECGKKNENCSCQ